MSTLLNLSNRLEAIVKLVDDYKTIADIGCDHGYVTAELILSNKCEKVIATDISRNSLYKAIRFCDSLNINNYVSFREGDGFKVIYKNDKVKQAIIAGMGGMEIINILENKTLRLKNFILQPMRDVVKLREYLIRNKYKILYDFIVYDEGIFYNILKVTKGRTKLRPLELYFGKDNFEENKEVFKQYLNSERNRLKELENRVGGLTSGNSSHLAYVEAGIQYLDDLQAGIIKYNKRRKYL